MKLKMPADQIQYSEKYFDAVYEYRHVILPPDLTKLVPKSHLMSESEWRNLGVQQSPGWVHYMMHAPEPHVILFRRPRTDVIITEVTSTAPNNGPDQSQTTSKNNVPVQG
uniref:Cyclin-dependent kinases regulatory subunit n=1 Tax=Glossina brevipalpis TaxID=37001 RepID=A0A1A9WPT4_9MUSC